MFNIEDYDYTLDPDLIAQIPSSNRDHSRLLLVDRDNASLGDYHFFDLPDLLKPGDIIVVNNTKVVPARIYGRKESGGKVEILVLEHNPDEEKRNNRWCLLKSSKGPRKGGRLIFEKDTVGIIEEIGDGGLTKILFNGPLSIDDLLEDKGVMPLPPYIKRKNKRCTALDRERYQTVFSSKKGAIAAPTAGLHFTEKVIRKLRSAGISLVELTLHVGHGTFRPVRVKDIRGHNLGEEIYYIGPDTVKAIHRAKKDGRRVIAVGTTVVRTLESIAATTGEITPGEGKTNLLIFPGFEFRVVDALITNFHLPKSSLLFLVSAFGGKNLIKKAYSRAIEKRYRFYSYGDAMLII
jgi:S-adenosylmethionine:tRNA ribosyltransferase-isomerase